MSEDRSSLPQPEPEEQTILQLNQALLRRAFADHKGDCQLCLQGALGLDARTLRRYQEDVTLIPAGVLVFWLRFWGLEPATEETAKALDGKVDAALQSQRRLRQAWARTMGPVERRAFVDARHRRLTAWVLGQARGRLKLSRDLVARIWE